MTFTVKRFSWNWDHSAKVLWASIQLADGTKHSIGFPLAHVVAEYEHNLAKAGYLELGGEFDEIDSVEGLFSSIKRAVKSVRNVAKKAVRATSSALRAAAKAGVSVVRSKALGYALAGVAVAFPAVGAPALAAQQAAKRAADTYDDAKRAVALARSGARDVRTLTRIAKGKNVAKAVKRLAVANTPASRMALAAMKAAG